VKEAANYRKLRAMSIRFNRFRTIASIGGMAALSLAPSGSLNAATAADSEDPYLWLEDVTGEKALNWVRQQNATSQKELESLPDFEPTRKRLLEILDSKEKIPYVSKHGAWY